MTYYSMYITGFLRITFNQNVIMRQYDYSLTPCNSEC